MVTVCEGEGDIWDVSAGLLPVYVLYVIMVHTNNVMLIRREKRRVPVNMVVCGLIV